MGLQYHITNRTISNIVELSAAGQTRTADHLVNSQVLYLLSYGGFYRTAQKIRPSSLGSNIPS